MTLQKRKVGNPPIIDAMVLFRFEAGRFSEACQTALKSVYPNRDAEFSNFLADVDHDNQNYGLFKSESKEQSIIVLPDSVVFRDGRKYKDRTTIEASIKTVWKAVDLDSIAKDICEIRFRVINKFEVKATELKEAIKILPRVVLPSERALISSMDFRLDILSELKGAAADVTVRVTAKNSEVVEVLFDIDTYLAPETPLSDFDSVSAYLLRLSELKNDVFFNNIDKPEVRFA